MILFAVMSSFFLFFIGLTLPLFGFLLPNYHMKRVEKWTSRQKLLIHGMLLLLLFIVQSYLQVFPLVYLYLSVPLVFILGYEYFYWKRSKNRRSFDEIFLLSLLSTCLLVVYISLFQEKYWMLYDSVLKTLREFYELPYESIAFLHKRLSLYYPSLLFEQLTWIIYASFVSVAGLKRYRYWKMHYFWVLPYLCLLLGDLYFSFENFYLINALAISRNILFWYGLKALYFLFVGNFRKRRWLLQLFVLLIGFQYPQEFAIFGGLFLLLEAWNPMKGTAFDIFTES